MKRRASLLIAGSGRLGGSLARGLLSAGWPVLGWPRTPASAKAWRRLRVPLASPDDLAAAEVLVIAVPDEAVAATAASLGPQLGPRTALVHCAGALSLSTLAPGAGRRPRGSFHPLCAISSPGDSLVGCGVALSATSHPLRDLLQRMALSLELLPLHVPEAGRAAYHAGAVMAAGGVVSVLAAVAALWRRAGVRASKLDPALLALTRSALRGIDRKGFQGGLTGPLARGDADRLRVHLAALPPAARPLYRELARAGLSDRAAAHPEAPGQCARGTSVTLRLAVVESGRRLAFRTRERPSFAGQRLRDLLTSGAACLNSPPVQTPVSFLNGGAAAMFSAECIKALNDAGYNQNDFGSYDHVRKKITAAKEKTKAWEDASPAQRKAKGLEKPTPEDRYLTGKYHPGAKNPFPNACQSGHLTQNGVYQATRDDPCSNVPGAPGHDMGSFPCMPQKGHANQKNGEHDRASRSEEEDAAAQGATGAKYKAKDIADDSSARTKSITEDKSLAGKNERKPLSPEARADAAADASAAGAKAKNAAATAPKDAKHANAPYNKPLTGKTAAECIDSFRKAGEAAMKDKCADARKENRETANGGPRNKGESARAYKDRGIAHREDLKGDAEGLTEASEAKPRDKDLKAAASDARSADKEARVADCRATQGERIAGGDTGNGDGIVPKNADRARP